MTAVTETIIVAFSMFSALPMPKLDWNTKNMRYALCAFPLVGVAVGAGCIVWIALCKWLAFPALLRGAGLCLLPVGMTGGIHLDGFADTCDALASHESPERKQEILSDPHLGAFAAMWLCAYFVADFALWASILKLDVKTIGAIFCAFCLSRALSGLAVATFPMAKNTGLAHAFSDAAAPVAVTRCLRIIIVLCGIALCLCGISGVAMLWTALFVFWVYHRMARQAFGGISGDLAGWFLQMAELMMTASLVFVQFLEAVV